MKQTITPAIKYIDGQPFVRVIDLGHQWHTNTSNILAIGKRHHVPEEQLRRIDGRVWCSFQGLRYRVAATKHGSSIAGRIREFLDSQEEKTEPKPAQATEPAATDLGTAALIADARRTASQALAKASDNEKRIDNLTNVIHDLQDTATAGNSEMFAAKEKAAKAISVSHASRNRARNNAQRLTRQAEKIQALENDSYRRFDTLMARCHRIERRQGDNAIELTGVKRSVWLLQWAAAGLAVVQVVGGIVRMARRR